MTKNILLFIVIISIFSSCATLQNNAKYELSNGNYKLNNDRKKYNCYIENNEDTILVDNLNSKISTALPKKSANEISTKQHLIKPSLDIDILTTVFKIRPKIENTLPTQLNANFNGNLYIGRRTDIYQIEYKKNQINHFQRQINHFGFSGGLFVGLGNTAMNPSTTKNGISTEYDGLIFQKGVAGIIAVNKLTLGLSIGFDNLLDQNKNLWIYENKPSYGLMLGLNLN
jgi:hypothetical protein